MNVLITGSAGFVGQELVRQLKSAGQFVIGIDIEFDPLADVFIQHDLAKPLGDCLNFQVCVHLASAVGGFLFNTRQELIQKNDQINANVLTLCRSSRCSHLIFFSSINVFETSRSFIHEPLSALDQITPYAYSKACSESFFSQAFQNCMIIRPTNLFGKSQRRNHRTIGESHVIPDLLKKIEEEDSVCVLGDGSQVRNFVHARDVCEFVTRNLSFSGKQYFNLRSNITITISDLVKELIDFSKKQVNVVFDPSYMKYELFKISNFDLNFPIQYGWKPEIRSIRDGLLI